MPSPAPSRARSATCTRASWTTSASAELGAAPLAEQLARVDAIDSIPALLRTLGELERDGIGGLIGLYVEPDPGNPSATCRSSCRAACRCPTRATTGSRTSTPCAPRTAGHIERMLEPRRAPRCRGIRRSHLRARDRGRHAPLGQRAQPRRGRDLQPEDLGRSAPRSPVSTCVRGSRAPPPAAKRPSPRSTCTSRASSRDSASLLTEERLEDWKAWLRFAHRARRGARSCPTTFVDENFAFYGTQLTGVPVNRERWKRGVGLVEARAGRGDRPRLRRAALPAGGEGARWTSSSRT